MKTKCWVTEYMWIWTNQCEGRFCYIFVCILITKGLCLRCQHLWACLLESLLLHLWSNFLLMHLGKQQMMPQTIATAIMQEPRWSPWLLAAAWLRPGYLRSELNDGRLMSRHYQYSILLLLCLSSLKRKPDQDCMFQKTFFFPLFFL